MSVCLKNRAFSVKVFPSNQDEETLIKLSSADIIRSSYFYLHKTYSFNFH